MTSKNLLLVLFVALAVVGCKRPNTIQNVSDQPITRYDSAELSMQQIERAIVLGGMEKGWTMQSVAPGHIVGSIDVRGKHSASVDIHYDKSTYSVTYKDSSNLDYQPPNLIHRNYNNWVTNLVRSINTSIQRVK